MALRKRGSFRRHFIQRRSGARRRNIWHRGRIIVPTSACCCIQTGTYILPPCFRPPVYAGGAQHGTRVLPSVERLSRMDLTPLAGLVHPLIANELLAVLLPGQLAEMDIAWRV